jgi:small subunit ribosomal protein S2
MEKNNTSSQNTVDNLFAVGAHFGFVKSRRHPSHKPFIFGTKNKIEIFDLEKTKMSLDKALEFVKELGAKNAPILFVGGKSEAKEAVEKAGQSLGFPYVAGRWLGGTLTNFPEIRKRVNKLETLLSQKEKGELAKYTKKERLLIDREIDRMKIFFTGLSNLKEMPKAVFIVDTKREYSAVAEAKALKIPIISLVGSDCNLTESTYPIPGNDASKASISYFVDQIVSAYRAGQLAKTQ